MLKASIIFISFFLTAPVSAEKSKKIYEGKTYEGIVLRVIDGDTLSAKVKLWDDLEKITRLRIRGIDAPEMRRPKCPQEKKRAIKARDELKKILGISKKGDQPKIFLFNVMPGKYHRDVADLMNEAGENIAAKLISAGLAQPYHGGKKPDWCKNPSP